MWVAKAARSVSAVTTIEKTGSAKPALSRTREATGTPTWPPSRAAAMMHAVAEAKTEASTWLGVG